MDRTTSARDWLIRLERPITALQVEVVGHTLRFWINVMHIGSAKTKGDLVGQGFGVIARVRHGTVDARV